MRSGSGRMFKQLRSFDRNLFSMAKAMGTAARPLVFALPLLLVACARPSAESGTFYEVDGVISMEAEHSVNRTGWEIKDDHTGGAIRVADSSGARVVFTVEVERGGRYALWVLGRKGRRASGVVEVDRSGNRIATIDFGENYAPTWTGARPDTPEPLFIELPSGRTELGFSAPFSYVLDKVALLHDSENPPIGYGPAETSARDAEPYPRHEIILPPQWAFGVLYGGYTNQSESLDRVTRLVDEGYPVDAYWVDSWFWDYERKGDGPGGYIDFVGDTVAYPDLEYFWSEFERLHVKAGIWTWNTILEKENEEVFQDFVDRGFCSRVYDNRDGWHNEGSNSRTCDIDFSRPDAVAYWKSLMKPFFDAGLDFFKLDRTAAMPFSRAGFEASQELGKETEGRGFILAHLHFTDDPEFLRYPTKWTGDAKIAWAQPDYPNMGNYSMGALTENIEMVANPLKPTYAIPFLSNDLGGYNYFGSEDQSDALYMRWTQFSAFNPVLQVFSTAANATANMPFNYSREAQDNFRKYMNLRMRLFPYIYTYAHRTRETGSKMIAGDGEHTHQYLFGDELLVAPVHEKDAVRRSVYLPAGSQWIDYWSGAVYDGGELIEYDAPLEVLPLFARAGAIIPMREPAGSIEAGSNTLLTLDVFPGAAGSFELIEDDGVSNAYLAGSIGRTLFQVSSDGSRVEIGAMDGTFEGAPDERRYRIKLRRTATPSRVMLDGAALPAASSVSGIDAGGEGWRYDPRNALLSIEFSTPTASARVLEIE